MRRFIKQILAAMLHYSGLLYLWRRPQPLILMYHRVLPESDSQTRYTQASVMVTPDVFDRQMAYLKSCYTVRSLAEVVLMLREKREIPTDTVVVTFDDGWYDNIEYALPILKKHNIPATIFLTTDFIGTNRMMWFLEAGVILHDGKLSAEQMADVFEQVKREYPRIDSLNAIGRDDILANGGAPDVVMELLKRLDGQTTDVVLKRLADAAGVSLEDLSKTKWMVDWDDVARMQEAGIEFGSHGCSHRIMTGLGDSELKRELTESKGIIEQKTGRPATILAYPNGDADDRVTGMAREAGYAAGIATHLKSGQAQPAMYELRRVGVHQGMSIGVSGRFSSAVFAFGLSRLSDRAH